MLGHATADIQLRNHLIHGAAMRMGAAFDAGANFNPGIFFFHNFQLSRSCNAILDPTQVLSLLKSTPIILPWLIRTRLLTRIGSGASSGQINIIRISAFDFGPSGVGTNSAYWTFSCRIHSRGLDKAASFSRVGSMSTPTPAKEYSGFRTKSLMDLSAGNSSAKNAEEL